MKSTLIFILASVVVVFSCKQETTKFKLNRTEKILVDSLFKEEITQLAPRLDSMCIDSNESNYQSIKDSVIAVRMSEIEQILPNQ